MPEVYGQSSARLRNSVDLPVPDFPVMISDSPGSSRRFRSLISCSPCRVADLDGVELDRAVRVGVDRHLRQRSALFVGGHQPVQPDDGSAVAGEHVVGVAEERQRVLDGAERRHRLDDRAELDLAGEQPRCLQQPRQRNDEVCHRQIPPGEHHGPVDEAPVVGQHRLEPRTQLAPLGLLAAVEGDGFRGIPQPHQRVAERGVEFLVVEGQPDQRTAEPERDDGGERDVDEHRPEHGARQLDTEE